jgi:hypothetical protein
VGSPSHALEERLRETTTDETIIVNHCRLFLPLGSAEIVPDTGKYPPELGPQGIPICYLWMIEED